MRATDGVYVKNIEEITIFESPDGGKTVYSRKSSDPPGQRTLVQSDPEAKNTERWLEWRQILAASETNQGLAELIEKAETFYKLLK